MSPNRKPIRVLFVCMGNICRSPAADIVFQHMVAEAGLDDQVDIDSAGTTGYHTGAPPDPRMAEELRARGYTISGGARKVRRADLDDFDLILPMDEDNQHDLNRLDRGGARQSKIQPFTGFCIDNPRRHVPDPYYGGPRGFTEVGDIIEDGCRGLLEHIRKSLASG